MAKWNTGIIDFRSMPEWRPPIFALLCAIIFGALLKYMLRPFSPDCNTYIFVLIQAATVCVSYWRREIGFFCASVENNKYGVCYDVIIRASEFMTFWAKLPFENGATRLSWDSSGTALTLPHFRLIVLPRTKTQSKSVSVSQMERVGARMLDGGRESFPFVCAVQSKKGRGNGRSDNPIDLESCRIWLGPVLPNGTQVFLSACLYSQGVFALLHDWMKPVFRLGRTTERDIVQELCESRGGRPGLSVLTSLLVSVEVKLYWTMLRHWSQLVPNMSTDIWGH